MIDFVTAPHIIKTQAGAPYHASRPSVMRHHHEYCGVTRKPTKVTQQMKDCRIVLASHGVPHVRPPHSCALDRVTFSPDTNLMKCNRVNCPINLNNKCHTLSMFSENDIEY